MSRKAHARGPGRGSEPATAEDGPWLEPEEVRPGLLLFVPAATPELAAVLATGAVRAVVAAAADLAGWREPCRRHGVALLVLDPAEDVVAADGAHLGGPARTGALRARLGAEGILGVACGRSRHTAMVAGEAGADYVMFGSPERPDEAGDELPGLVGWWNELFVIPCAAAIPPEPALAAALVAAGADLLALRATSPETVMAVAGALATGGVER